MAHIKGQKTTICAIFQFCIIFWDNFSLNFCKYDIKYIYPLFMKLFVYL